MPYGHKRSRKAQSLDERLEGHDFVVEELLEFFLVQLLVCDWVTGVKGVKKGRVTSDKRAAVRSWKSGSCLQSNSKYSGSSEDTAGSSSGSCCVWCYVSSVVG